MRNATRIIVAAAGVAALSKAGAANLVVNPDFSDGLIGWTTQAADGGRTSVDPRVGWPEYPSAHLFGSGSTRGVALVSSCMPVDDTTHYDLYVSAGVWSGQGAFGVVPFADADCATPGGDSLSQAIPYSALALQMADFALPAGTHGAQVVLVVDRGPNGEPPDANFDDVLFGPAGTVAGINADQEGLSGTWYDPDSSGQGIQLEVTQEGQVAANGSLFGAWYTYGDTPGGTGSQRWYWFLSAMAGDTRLLSFNILSSSGGNFAAPPITNADSVGQGFLSFDSCESGTMHYRMNDGRTGTIPLRRLLPNVGCVEEGAPTNASSDFGLSGAWYDPSTSGQGLLVEVNPESSQVFMGWYTYPERGESGDGLRWFSAQGAYTVGSRSMDVTLYSSQNGTFGASSGAAITRPVGSATLTYTDCQHLTFDYAFSAGEFEGKRGSMELGRTDLPPQSCPLGTP